MPSRALCRSILGIFLATVVFGAASTGSQQPVSRYTETITAKKGKTLSFDMVLIPGGEFLMGSPVDAEGRKAHEGPQHRVELDPYYLATTETTMALILAYYEETVTEKKAFVAQPSGTKTKRAAGEPEVDAVTGPTPVYGDITMGHTHQYPAIGVSWHNAMTFCRWLNFKTGRSYRLPTEAEWEYACRAGTTHPQGFGDPAQKIEDYAWFDDNADVEIHEVGQKAPNPWGLHDMFGNVNEWVYDYYDKKAYTAAAGQSPARNPTGPEAGRINVARGGDYSSPREDLRCAARAFEENWWRDGDPQIPKSRWWLPELDIIGIRVACTVEAGK